MYESERRITLRYGIDDNSNSEEIVNLIDRLILIHHFLIYREEVLYPASDFRLDTGIFDFFPDFLNNAVYKCLSLRLSRIYLLYKAEIDRRLQIAKRQIIHLRLNACNTEPARDR